jgi:hypothetical protein
MKGCSLLLLPVVACVMTAYAEEPCLRNAWDALNKKDYITAIRAADECISNFHLKAERDQSALDQKGEPAPPTGTVSAPDKQRIFSRGVLNDTATAYFIKGKAAEALAKKNREYLATARAAYENAKKLTYARVWDPQGWFWSPSEAAADRLADLK